MQAEIAHLLNQCSPEELERILRELESGDGTDGAEGADCATPRETPPRAASTWSGPPPSPQPPPQRRVASTAATAASGSEVVYAPVPPAAPPPAGGVRRPAPSVAKRHSAAPAPAPAPCAAGASGGVVGPEVAALAAGVGTEALGQALAERDREAACLEARLAELHGTLAAKEQRANSLSTELEDVVRQVRHQKLDLEFQMLKLEERLRSNAEAELAQRACEARPQRSTEDLSLGMCRGLPAASPITMRLQGSLPWTLRSMGSTS